MVAEKVFSGFLLILVLRVVQQVGLQRQVFGAFLGNSMLLMYRIMKAEIRNDPITRSEVRYSAHSIQNTEIHGERIQEAARLIVTRYGNALVVWNKYHSSSADSASLSSTNAHGQAKKQHKHECGSCLVLSSTI